MTLSFSKVTAGLGPAMRLNIAVFCAAPRRGLQMIFLFRLRREFSGPRMDLTIWPPFR